MLVPVVAFPVSAVTPVTPLRRASGQAKADKDGGGARRDGNGRGAMAGDRRDAPRSAAGMSSSAVLSALLDLQRGG